MLLGNLDSAFQFGVLLVSDSSASDPIPEWTSAEEQVTASYSAAVIRVRHADEGTVTVRVWDDDDKVEGALAYDGYLETDSGAVTVSDAIGNSAIRIEANYPACRLQVFVNSSVEADRVDIVLCEALLP